jgi:hypothetical protein
MVKKIGVMGWMIRLLLFVAFEYFMYLVAGARAQVKSGVDFFNLPSYLQEVLEHPFEDYSNKYTVTTLVIGAVVYFLVIVYMISRKHNLMIGREYGDSKFADPKKISRKLSDQSGKEDDPENVVIIRKRFGR